MSGSDRAERAADLHAELGYRTSGLREIKQRDWFSLRGDPNEPLPTPAKFDSLVRRLYAKKWKEAHPDRWRAYRLKHEAKPSRKAARVEKERRRRLRRKAAGLCISCATPVIAGRATCEACLAARRKPTARMGRPRLDLFPAMVEHRKWARVEKELHRYNVRRAAGLCVRCEAPSPLRNECDPCRQRRQQLRRSRKAAKSPPGAVKP